MTSPRREKRPTMIDVARAAGVSHQTVSRYLRFSGGLKPATVSSIEKAIAELDYRPNLVARSMRTRRTGRLAIVVPTLSFNPSRMLSGAGAVANGAGFLLDVISFEGDPLEREQRLLEMLDAGQVEGVLSIAPLGQALRGRIRADVPVIVTNDFDDDMRWSGEHTDASVMRQIVERLAALGHRRLFHVSGDLTFPSARARRAAYLDAVDALGLESAGTFDEGDWSGATGVRAVESLSAESPPTALTCGNDLIATAVIHAADARGWRVPDDLSVIGWNDDAPSAFLRPPLTSVSVDLEEVGARAMRRLVSVLREEPESTAADAALSHVVWRRSVGPAPAP